MKKCYFMHKMCQIPHPIDASVPRPGHFNYCVTLGLCCYHKSVAFVQHTAGLQRFSKLSNSSQVNGKFFRERTNGRVLSRVKLKITAAQHLPAINTPCSHRAICANRVHCTLMHESLPPEICFATDDDDEYNVSFTIMKTVLESFK